MPGGDGSQRGMFEDLAPSERDNLEGMMRDSEPASKPPKNLGFTESRSDSESSAKTDNFYSRPELVASLTKDEWLEWAGL